MSAVEAHSRLEFRVLGPLEVVRDGRPISLGGPRQRALLAALLIQANRTVSVATLMDELFGAEAATMRENRVHVNVSRLRRALSNGRESPVLLTQPGGYQLQVDPGQVDCAVFERLLERGQDALAAGRPRAAAELLDRADSLWHGPAFADLAFEEVTQAEIRRLDGLRLELRIDRIEAGLMLGHHAELVPVLEQRVLEHPAQERLLGQLMIALYRSGRQVDALAVCDRQKRVLRDQLGLDPGPAVRELEQAILRQDPELASTSRVVAEDAPPVEICPYKGLASYSAADARFFAGRERLVDALIRRAANSRFIGMIGSSGVGKSSTLQGGLLPALARGALPGSSDWQQLVVRPGPHPQRALAAALAEPADGSRRIVAVDQFEEVFTVCRSETTRRRFVAQLVELASGRDTVIVAVRADYYGRCAAYPEFGQLLSTNHELVQPMSGDELVRAITMPAEAAGLRLEPGVIGAMVDDVVDTSGGLPLLSTTLLELWGMREEGTITLASYRSLGGVEAAVARLAERAYAVLNDAQRDAARALLMRLATTDGDTDVPRRAQLEEFELPHNPEGQAALEVLTEFRLLTVDDDSVEVSHETLLHAWPRLEQWLSDDRIGHRLHLEITAAAAVWASGGRSPEDLYRGGRLAAAVEWAEAHPLEPNQLEREFIATGQAEGERAFTLERLRNRRLRILLVASMALLVVASLAALIAITQRHTAQAEARTALARQLGEEAVVEPRLDRALLLAREAVNLSPSPQTEGALLATLDRSPAAVATFTVPISSRPLTLGLSPDGSTLAVGDNLGNVRLFDSRTRRATHVFVGSDVSHTPPLFSSSGSRMYAPGARGVQVIDANTDRVLRVLRWSGEVATVMRAEQVLASLTLLRTGGSQLLAVLGPSTSAPSVFVARWDVRTGVPAAPTLRLTGGSLLTAAVADHGHRLIVVTNRVVTTWTLPGLHRLESTAIRVPIQSVGALSPSTRELIIGTQTGEVSFINTLTGARVSSPIHHAGTVQNVAFSPDGRLAVSVGDDRQVLVWNPATASLMDDFSGHAGRVTGIAFSHDGQTLYTSSLDGAIFEWALGASRRFGRTFTTAGPPASAVGTAFSLAPTLAPSPTGADFVTALRGGRAGIFSVARGSLAATSARVGAAVSVAAWGSNSAVTLGTDDGRVLEWNRPLRSSGMKTLATVRDPISGIATADHGGVIATVSADASGEHGQLVLRRGREQHQVTLPSGGEAVALSRNATRVVVLVGDVAEIRNTQDLGLVTSLHLVGAGTTAAFAPSGILVTGSYAGVVQRWNLATGHQIGQPTQVAAAPVSSIAVDPAGQALATGGGSDGAVTLWDLRTMEQLGTPFPAYPPHFTWESIAYTEHGQTLTVLDDDGHGQVWPITLDAWERHACRVAGRTLSPLEWTRYVGTAPYTAVCAFS